MTDFDADAIRRENAASEEVLEGLRGDLGPIPVTGHDRSITPGRVGELREHFARLRGVRTLQRRAGVGGDFDESAPTRGEIEASRTWPTGLWATVVPPTPACTWTLTEDDGTTASECGLTLCWEDDPQRVGSHLYYCQKCGRPIAWNVVDLWEDEPDVVEEIERAESQ